MWKIGGNLSVEFGNPSFVSTNTWLSDGLKTLSLRKFQQEWTNNMSQKTEPTIGTFNGQDYTVVFFEPDLKRFNMEKLDKDIIDLLSRRAYDIAGISGEVTVYLNDKKLPVTDSLKDMELVN